MKNYCIWIPAGHPCDRNWGHLIRDLCYLISYKFNFQKGESNVYLICRSGRFKKLWKDFVIDSFCGKVSFISDPRHLPRETIMINDKIHAGFAEDWPKIAANKFRDLSLKSFNVDTKIKNKILFVPRKITGKRFIYEHEKITNQIKSLFGDYELTVWYNEEHSFREQIQTWAESKIIIAACGADLANATWCDDYQQRIIEIMSPMHYSGHSTAFYNPNITEMINREYGKEKAALYNPIPGSSPRDWHFVYAPEQGDGGEIYLSEENHKEIIKLIQEVTV